METRMAEGNVKAMQQFVGKSPWEWEPVWERLDKRMTAELEPVFGQIKPERASDHFFSADSRQCKASVH